MNPVHVQDVAVQAVERHFTDAADARRFVGMSPHVLRQRPWGLALSTHRTHPALSLSEVRAHDMEFNVPLLPETLTPDVASVRPLSRVNEVVLLKA